jgi:hypothetical protein
MQHLPLQDRPLFPYPSELPERIGFIIGDVVLAGLFIMLLVMLFPTFVR